jgi:hypothetical protein
MERHYTPLINELLELFPCVALVGVRQSGKTTLLKQLPANWSYFDLEKASDYDVISNDPDLFFRLNPNRVAIDEAQLLPNLFTALRVAIDEKREETGRFIITGSSSPELLTSISESLAGRIAVIEVAPFSLAESFSKPLSPLYQAITNSESLEHLLKLKPRFTLQEVHEYWFKGGYPEPWLKNSPRFTKLWMDNYNKSYIDRDILRMFPGLNQQKYRLFIRLLSNLSGKIINYSDIARTLSISQPTAREYLHIAHGTFIWRHIPPFDRSASKRLVKHPKGYMRDSGMLHNLLHIKSKNDLQVHPCLGASWESMIIENLLRNLNALGINYDYYHYRTGGGAEIDLILEGNFGLLPIEIKYGQKVNQKNLRGINDFINEHNCQYGIVINNDEQPRLYNEKLIGLPSTLL